ncbi:ABC transporter permease [Pseudochrobactrum sp. MP213Fo]|uniref:ABC transporter permease n=1 Tax=Pseudochrobactrum sp. MP213Fo TaxID=3022250 RepID=UPI003BA29918
MSTATRKPGGARLAAFALLVIPLMTYLFLYLAPLGSTIALSVENGQLGESLVEFRAADHQDREAQTRALLNDMHKMDSGKQATAARELNQELSGFRSLFLNTARKSTEIDPSTEGLIAFDKRWTDDKYWNTLEANASALTTRHYQQVMGLVVDGDGNIAAKGDDIYLQIMLRTLVIAAQVTALTLLIGYPLAYAIANAPPRFAALVLVMVLMSFWISILVRTTAWVVLLQTNGLLNSFLIAAGIISQPLQLIFNRFGAVISMTHVLLPFAVIPMMNVMRTIPKSQTDASQSLGAGPVESFLRVYFPQTLRGVFVGGGTVFILALGFYITPALTGGPGDQMVAFYIADFIKRSLNWGMASALSTILLTMVLIIAGLIGAIRWLSSARKGRIA